jgi:hypothetical protein
MEIEIFSVMAAIAGKREITWQGLVNDVMLAGEIAKGDEDALCDRVYRLFNRVDENDGDRLERWKYFLPSLSLGDYVRIGDNTYRVDTIGFTKITNNPAVAAELLGPTSLK